MNSEEAKTLWENKEYLTKGKRGLIYTATHNNKKYIIKTKNPESKAENTIRKEYENNKLLNKYDVGPKMYYYDEQQDFVIREHVDGEKFFDWIKNVTNKQKIKNVFNKLIEQCKRMDEAKINKLELNHPHKDIIIKNDEPTIIDFERCKKTTKPKNITQISQFITSGKVKQQLKKFNTEINKQKILHLAEKYKQELIKNEETKTYKEIKKEINKSFKTTT